MDNPPMNQPVHGTIRQTVHFSGQVQGVGFRYTTKQISERYPIVGSVENLRDGRVLLIAEGPGDQVNAFVREVIQWMGQFIIDHTIETSPATGEFGDPGLDRFTIHR